MKRLLLTLLWTVVATLPLVTRAQVYARTPAAPPPPWAPPGHARAQYYYLPDLQVYYDVPAASFLLPHRGHWIALRQLPPAYRSYDLYAAPKVVLDYYGPYPYRHYEAHRQRFPRWNCPPHSVIVYRDVPAPAGPRGHHPGRRYHYNPRHDDDCNGRCPHEHHQAYRPRDEDRPYDSPYGNDDRPYAPERPGGEPEREYDYYNGEETGQAGPRGRWR
jgi:hypothetical protein